MGNGYNATDLAQEYYMQSGTWEIGGLWNASAGFPGAINIADTGKAITGAYTDFGATGIALPSDYDGTVKAKSVAFVYVNGYNPVIEVWGGFAFRIDYATVSPRCNPANNPALASIAYYGTSDAGKAMVGSLCSPVDCMASQVWRTAELDVCGPRWFASCQPPTGSDECFCGLGCSCSGECVSDVCEPTDTDVCSLTAGPCHYLCDSDSGGHVELAFTPDGAKAYAITRGCESAFSVSRDDGKSWNQKGLIDTVIDCLGDVQVTLDCGTAYLTSTNHDWCGCSCRCGEGAPIIAEEPEEEPCPATCDSVWRSQIDDDHAAIGTAWERVYCKEFSDCCCCQDCGDYEDPGLLRLPPGGFGDVIYLADYGSKNMWYSLDWGQCWNKTPETKVLIHDFALEDEKTVYVLDNNGMVSKSDSYGRHPTLGVDTLVGSGHTIAVVADGNVLVGGKSGGKVAYSSDGGDTFSRTPALPAVAGGKVHIAFDNNYATNNTIYAAVSGVGIYRIAIGDTLWKDLKAAPYWYYGIVLGKSDGTLYAPYQYCYDLELEPCEDCVYYEDVVDCCLDGAHVGNGVARTLSPAETPCCDKEFWDYLHTGLDLCSGFTCEPSALRICGCVTAATDSTLWAIDCCPCDRSETIDGCCPAGMGYNMVDGKRGTLWQYTDCVAKKGPTLVAPADGAILNCDACACYNAPFNLEWSRLCNACSYDILIKDEQGNTIKQYLGWGPPLGGGASPSLLVQAGVLTECGATYKWMVRVSDSETGELIKSPWSTMGTFTIAQGSAGAITLLAPEHDATGVMRSNVAFSWTTVPNATGYKFVLSANSDLSSPLAEAELAATSYGYTGTLGYSTSYYWQVMAMKNGDVISTSAVGVFSTEAEPPEAPPEPPPPPEPGWPPYATAIIIIGAALMAVVVVLIWRTRRAT
jgi:hypothetical protein